MLPLQEALGVGTRTIRNLSCLPRAVKAIQRSSRCWNSTIVPHLQCTRSDTELLLARHKLLRQCKSGNVEQTATLRLCAALDVSLVSAYRLSSTMLRNVQLQGSQAMYKGMSCDSSRPILGMAAVLVGTSAKQQDYPAELPVPGKASNPQKHVPVQASTRAQLPDTFNGLVYPSPELPAFRFCHSAGKLNA